MSLAATVTITVGHSIAKGILKLWLKDSVVAENVGTGLLDLFKTKTLDFRAQQKGSRLFEEMGERVAETLLPIFEMEGARLDEGDRISVAEAIAETLDKAGITSKLLIKQNLDPSELSDYLTTYTNSSINLFSTDQIHLYKRILSEISQSIVDISSSLPSFTENNFSEILSGQDRILGITQELLDEIRAIKESSYEINADIQTAQYESEYRRTIIRKLDELQLFGVDISSAENKRHSLSIAYITLSVEQFTSYNEEETHNPSKGVDLTSGEYEQKVSTEVVSADKALSQSSNLLIKGLAGSGKTTLLQWIAVKAASRSFEQPLLHWNDRIPFFLPLRKFSEDKLPSVEEFPEYIAPLTMGNMPKGWVTECLKNGRSLVLVDGIDEIPQSRREDVRKWLKDIKEEFKQSILIVTSRPSAIEEGWLEEGFDEADLLPMKLSDIYVFIDHWHAAVKDRLQKEDEKANIIKFSNNLKQIINKTKSIRNLATSPLLCAMICALHRDRNQQLPKDRIELYDACCSMLLDRRDTERGIKLSDYFDIGYRYKLLLLQDLSYYLLRNSLSMISMERAQLRFEDKLTHLHGLPQNVTGHHILKLFLDRSGLVREPTTGNIDFVHRTFQEYLGAIAVLEADDIGFLIDKADDDQWREVIILVAGKANSRIREELINGLIYRGDKEPHLRHTLHLLAVACLEVSIELNKRVQDEVNSRLENLIPPTNMTEAKALASAEDLAVPYLLKGVKSKGTIAAACVRTLVSIGSVAALEALEKFKNDNRQIVMGELVKGWEYFNREEYAKRILLNLSIINTSIQGNTLEEFKYITNLTSLYLQSCYDVTDLTPLSNSKKLQVLFLSGCRQISDVNCLANLISLKSLRIHNCNKLTDIYPISNLTSLVILTLTGCIHLTDISPLSDLILLKHLDLSECNELVNIKPISKLKQLENLDLSYCPTITDITPLSDLKLLNSLRLTLCKNLTDLFPLSGLLNLTMLDLSFCERIIDLTPVSNLKKLMYLDLSCCENIYDLSPLSELANLVSLDLSGCINIIDLNPLREFKKLSHLDILNCGNIKDFSPLTGMTNLKTLRVSTNNRSNIDYLRENMPNTKIYYNLHQVRVY